VTSRPYWDVLEEGLRPLYEPGDFASVHVKGCTPEWLEEHGIWTIDWPPHSPDLNPIEHVWHALKKKIRKIEHNFHELKGNIPHEA
jgi:transposase